VEINNNKQSEVTYKFFLPDNKDELFIFQNASKFFIALHDIHDRCKDVWKYKADPTMEEFELAERIGEVVSESGIFDIE